MKHCRNDTSGISSLSDEKGNKVSAPDQLANILNTQFQSVFTIEIPAPQDLLPHISPFPRMPDVLISKSGVLKLLQELKVHKADGPDQVRPRVLKELSHIIAPILLLIYRRSYDKAQVPDDWKKLI